MPRPTSKVQLLEYARENFEKLQKEIADLTQEQKIDPGVVGDWSVKDVLAHLLEWQRMSRSWYAAGKRGETPVTPSEDYTWREIPALNQHIYETYKDNPLDEIERDFLASHDEMMALIETMDDEELFTPKVYKWTKSTTLGSYLTSSTSSHYDWARKEIRWGLKAKRKQASSD
jgi:hypothetical protein